MVKDSDGRPPRGPAGGALLLFIQRWCRAGGLLGLSSSVEREFLRLSKWLKKTVLRV